MKNLTLLHDLQDSRSSNADIYEVSLGSFIYNNDGYEFLELTGEPGMKPYFLIDFDDFGHGPMATDGEKYTMLEHCAGITSQFIVDEAETKLLNKAQVRQIIAEYIKKKLIPA